MQNRFELALLLLPLALLVAACGSYEPPKTRPSGLANLETGVRQDCNAILGTAFRAAEERQWFEQNCSRWPAVAVAPVPAAAPGQQQPAPAGASAIPGDTPQCAAMRGRPYSSEQDRTWFLQNCVRPEAPANPAPAQQPGAVPSQPQQQPGAAPPPTSNSTAAVCETLRRSQNPTDEQRRWYFTYCNVR